MNKKSTIHKIIIMMIIILIGIDSPKTANASQVLKGVTTLNENNTAIINKYGVTGEILKIYKESKSVVVLTKDGIYYIYSGKVKKYTFSGSIMDTTTFYKSGQEVYVSPILQTDSKGNSIYVEVKLNLSSGSKKVTTNYSEYMDKINLMWKPNSISTFTDAYNNKWFSTFYNFSTKYYELFRIDTLGDISKVETSKDYYNDPFSAYDKLSLDSDRNVYYTYTGGSNNATGFYIDAEGNKSKVLSELCRVDKNLKKKIFEVYGTIEDYEISPTGDVWVLSGNNTLIRFNKSGKKIAKISLNDGKDICIEPSGSVYVLDANKIKLVYKNKLYIKHTLNSDYRYNELSMAGNDNLVASNENTFEIIDGSNKEVIVSDSTVKYRPYIVKDNKGNITIFSKNNNTQHDTNIKMYQIGSSGISFHDIFMDIGEYNKAIGYDGTFYIPHIDDEFNITINLLKNDLKIEKYVTLHVSSKTFIGMQMDSKKNLYVLTNQSLYKVSPTKKIQVIDITDKKGGYGNGIMGFIKDKYNNLYVKYRKPDYNFNFHEYGLLKVNDNLSDIKQVKLDSSDIYADLIFVTSKNEIAMINTVKTKEIQMYIIDSKGNPVRDNSYDGKSYYTPGLVSQLERIWKAYDGTLIYQTYGRINKKTATKEIMIADINQVIDDANGTIYYTDASNLYIYDKKLPKVTSVSPQKNQSKIPITSKMTLQISEPVMKGNDFGSISLSANGSKVSVKCSLADNKIVITPKANLKSKVKYTVNIPAKAVMDIAGNTLSGDYTYTFTTQ